jgi:hypothetical protein
MDPDLDPDPSISSLTFKTPTNKIKSFSAYYFLKIHLHNFSKLKSPKEVKTEEIKVFLTSFA